LPWAQCEVAAAAGVREEGVLRTAFAAGSTIYDLATQGSSVPVGHAMIRTERVADVQVPVVVAPATDHATETAAQRHTYRRDRSVPIGPHHEPALSIVLDDRQSLS
jgi:hypothetical protein